MQKLRKNSICDYIVTINGVICGSKRYHCDTLQSCNRD